MILISLKQGPQNSPGVKGIFKGGQLQTGRFTIRLGGPQIC